MKLRELIRNKPLFCSPYSATFVHSVQSSTFSDCLLASLPPGGAECLAVETPVRRIKKQVFVRNQLSQFCYPTKLMNLFGEILWIRS